MSDSRSQLPLETVRRQREVQLCPRQPVSSDSTTDCENNVRDLKHLRKESNLQMFAKMRHFGKESLLGCATRPVQTKMVVLEIEPQHAENTHILMQIQIPEFMLQFQDDL